MLERIRNNPVIVGQIIIAVCAAVAIFGFDLDPQQVAVVLGLVGIPVTFAQRKAVTPNRKL